MDSYDGAQMQNRYTSNLSDDVLVANCTTGDESAFDELMKRHHPTALKGGLLYRAEPARRGR